MRKVEVITDFKIFKIIPTAPILLLQQLMSVQGNSVSVKFHIYSIYIIEAVIQSVILIFACYFILFAFHPQSMKSVNSHSAFFGQTQSIECHLPPY